MGPPSHTRLARLSRQLRQATPEQLEAIERILAGPVVPGRPRRGQPRCALHREGSLWRLTFDDDQAILKHEQGICYVAEMLSHPRERVKKLNLAAKYSSPRSPRGGGIEIYDPATGRHEPLSSLAPGDEAALARARELKETIGDLAETERAKVEAREELKVIAAHLSKDSRTLRDPAKAAGDAVRIGINRFLRNLVGRGDTVVSPLRVRRGFAKHLQRYLLVPSSRYAAPRARKARGELTGCLLYDPPAGTRWAVSQ